MAPLQSHLHQRPKGTVYRQAEERYSMTGAAECPEVEDSNYLSGVERYLGSSVAARCSARCSLRASCLAASVSEAAACSAAVRCCSVRRCWAFSCLHQHCH